MARLLKGDKMSEPPRARRVSFKTKASNDRKGTVRAVRVTIASSKVAVIASKFNAVVVEDELKGRALVKLHAQQQGNVKAAIQKFEGLQPSKMVLVRKTSSIQLDNSHKTDVAEKAEGSGKEAVKLPPKPTIGRQHNQRYVRKDFKELLGKNKRLSLPRTQILDEALNETMEKLAKTSIKSKQPSIKKVSSKSVAENHRSADANKFSPDNAKVAPSEDTPNNESETVTDGVIHAKNIVLESSLHNSTKPNSSFLWGIKEKLSTDGDSSSTIVEESIKSAVHELNLENLKESSVDEKENEILNVEAKEELLAENKENLEKLETPIVRTGDKKGYGKINIQANNSSLYRNILKQRLIGEVKEILESKERNRTLEKNKSEVRMIKEGEDVNEDKKSEKKEQNSNNQNLNRTHKTETDKEEEDTFVYRNSSERNYEVIDQDIYEVVENNYDVIKGGDDEETIYDDVHGNNDRIYESIDNGKFQNDSDSSCEQNNSLYDLRPPSQASSGGSGAVLRGGTSRSDTSDDWVDIELDSSEEQKEQILLLQGTPRIRSEGWSVKVRRQWSSRSTNRYVTNDSDSSSKHYEHVDNPDNDSALCDDFDDSSDSDCSVDNNYKPNVEERLQPEVNQTDTIYSLMKERMRKTSSTIGKSLRRISRMSTKQTSAQDILNGNGVVRGKWHSFKKKIPIQGNSTFYLNEINETKKAITPPPRPPPPVFDPRRASISVRPTSPPPPPPVLTNGDSKGKSINDTSLYAECGLFEQNHGMERRSNTTSWYSDVGLYENCKPSDTSSEHGSSQGSDIDLRFADEPLYQFYTERVTKQELSDSVSETGYEEIGENKNIKLRPSALDLVSPEMNRTLWCHVPQVISSGILDTLLPEQKRLQEAKFEVLTSEASYYKSLNILEKHFAASPLFKNESVLPKVHYKTLFGNVTAIRKCSEAVLAALDKCWQESILLEGLSDVVNQVAEQHFSAYKKYCSHQQAIERTVNTLKKTNQAFVDALETLQNSPKCHHLTFYSFVLLPMQRITRMPLLQDAILTKLSPSDSDYQSCQYTLATLNKIVHECNEAARHTDRLEEMATLSSKIQYPLAVRKLPLLSASRWLVRSGDMTQVSVELKTTFSKKRTAPKSSKLRVFLFTDYLVITKKKTDDVFNVVTYCERNLVQMNDTEETLPNRFLIMLTLLKNHEGKTQEMLMCCGGESSRARWISALSPPAPTDPDDTAVYEDWDCPQVSATHAYISSQPDELTLQNGDIMNVFRKTADGWYYGERTRDAEKGWFPGNHTAEILSSHVRARNLRQRYRLLALSEEFIKKQQMGKIVS